MERALQTEHEFHHLEKELESHLQFSTEQLKSSQHQSDKGMIYQVGEFWKINLVSLFDFSL